MGWDKRSSGRIAAALLGFGILAGCTQAPDMAGIEKERQRAVQRYDIVQALAANQTTVVAGTQSGAALVSRDQGQTWVRHTLGKASLVDIAACGKAGFVAIDHYHQVWSADAEGANWQSTTLERPQTPLAVTCDPQGGWWVAGTNATIAGSKDQGKSWQVTDLGEDAQITTLQFIDSKQAVAFGEFGMALQSLDGGASWQKLPKIPGDFYPYAALFRNGSEGWLSGIAGQMLATSDGGKTWHKQTNAAVAPMYRLFFNDGIPFGVGAAGVMARFDNKETWRPVSYTDPLPVFLSGGVPLPGQAAVVIGGPGGLLRVVATASKQ